MRNQSESKQSIIRLELQLIWGIYLGPPNVSRVQKSDDFPIQGQPAECHEFRQAAFRGWVLCVQEAG